MSVDLFRYAMPEDGTLLDVIEAIKNNKSRCVILIAGGRVSGVLSEGDVMSALLHGADVHVRCSEYANRSFKFLSRRDHEKALGLMRDFGLTLLPIVDKDFHLVDVITLSDVLKRVALVPLRP